MWMAMINADVEGIKKHAEALNVGDFYGLFACMLAARSWEALQAGIDKQEFTTEEVIKTYILCEFIFGISCPIIPII